MGSSVAQSNLFFQSSLHTDILRDLEMMEWGMMGLNLTLEDQLIFPDHVSLSIVI